ncbi:MAG: beta-phosphoglucomutase [bacterium]
MIKGVIFDLDGVLVSTDHYHYRSWVQLCVDEGFTFFDHEFNHKFRGVGRMQCVDILLDAAGKNHYTKEQRQEIADRKNRYFVESLESVTPGSLLPGSRKMLEALRQHGIKIAIASNSRNAKPIIERTEIGHLLDAVVDGFDIENSKPDPEVFLQAAERLGLSPKECIVVEDAVAGILAAERAGIRSLGIGTHEILPNATTLVKDLSEINVEELLRL